MSVGDIYRLKHTQELAGQQVINVYFYEHAAGSGGAEDLNVAFILDVLPAVRDIQAQSLIHVSLEAENVDDLVDYALHSFTGVNGLQAGEYLASFVAWSFIQNRTSKATRHGHKRVAGVVEGAVTNGIATAGQITVLNAYAEAVGSDIEDATGNTFSPVIVRNPDDEPTRIVNPVSSAAYQRLTTQSSRKIGVGA